MSMLRALPIMVAVLVLPLRARAQDTTHAKPVEKVGRNIGRATGKAAKDTKNAVSKAGKDTGHEARRTKHHVGHALRKLGHGAHEVAGDASKSVKGAKKDTTHSPPGAPRGGMTDPMS
ncbi:MAG: hypothetical protein ACR2OG_15725 [Gemmatimonadaceae bacterium]